jgi:hypothetical protein
VATTAASR